MKYRIVGESQPPATPAKQSPDELSAHRDSLYHRLEQGYDQIEQALKEGEDPTTWEDFWVALLVEYERVCDELQRDLAV